MPRVAVRMEALGFVRAPRRDELSNHSGNKADKNSVLVESGVTVGAITSLADLIQPDRFKAILRHYHKQANEQPNAFAICLAQTLIQVAKYFVGVTPDELNYLKRIASKFLPFALSLPPRTMHWSASSSPRAC